MPGQLAEVFSTHQPGLPRGRASLPAETVQKAQRERLLRAVMSAVADRGYAPATVADIVKRARVSRKAFYEQFADKEDCFLAAAVAGTALLSERVAGAAAEAGEDPVCALQASMRAYLELCASEPEFARCLLIELLSAGPRALRLRNAGYSRLAALFRAWHDAARHHRPDWPAVADEAYPAAVGAVHELVFGAVSRGHTKRLPDLERPLLEILLAIFAVPVGGRSQAA